MSAAWEARRQGASPEEAADALLAFEPELRRPYNDGEVQDAVDKVYESKAPAGRKAKWPVLNEQRRAEIVVEGKGLEDLKGSSPVPLGADRPSAREIIEILFPDGGDTLLCFGKSNRKVATHPWSLWRGKLDERWRLMVPSPMKSKTGNTKDGKESARCLDNTGPRRFLVVEFDEGTFDEQASILAHLSNFGRLAMVVFSGSKSLHGWFHVQGQSEDLSKRFMDYAVSLGADPATWTLCQLVRTPCARRDKDNVQEVYFLSPDALNPDGAATQEVPETGARAGLFKDWVYINAVERYRNVASGLELKKKQFHDRYCHAVKKVSPISFTLYNPAFPIYDRPIYLPGRDRTFEEKGISYFNLWQPGDLTREDGDVSPFLEHAAYILPDDRERNILLDYLAFNVQRPGDKVQWAILLQGNQGTGKSFFGSVMRQLLGAHNVSLPSNEQLHEIYTGWQKSCSLVVIEEMMAVGRLDLMNKLKPMITQDIAMIREMYREAFEQPNVFNFLMFTNHEDAILVDEDDRRYCILYSPAEKRDTEYYRELWGWLREHAGRLLGWTLNRDLNKFDPMCRAPMTNAKQLLIQDSLPPVAAWMKECIEQESWPFMGDLVCPTHLLACLPSHLRNTNLNAITKTGLKKVGARALGQVPINEQRLKIWAIRRQDTWASVGKEALAAEYLRWGGDAQPGGREDAETGGNPLWEARPM
jgi:hypothetical protein|tara:strand:- start:1962 stop:4067 length:2106 start_codon:yes stop_codon:yes gene_type:complete